MKMMGEHKTFTVYKSISLLSYFIKTKFIPMKKLFTLLLLLFVFNFAFAQFAHQNVNLLGTFDDPTVQPESVYGIRYQGCWGYADSLGNEYGIIGSTAGTYFVDITDPTNPVQKTYIPHRQNDCICHEYK